MSRNRKRFKGSSVRDKSSSAFTLIELMVSMAILGLIMVILFSIFEEVNKAWLNSENRVETFTQGRAILDLLSRDLSQAIATPKIPFYGKDANNIYFVAPLNTDPANQADLCEVGYEFDPATFTLTRRLTEPTPGNISGIWDFYTNPNWWIPSSFDPKNNVVLANNTILNISFQYLDINLVPITYLAPANKLPYGVSITIDAVDSRTFARLKLVPNVGTAWQSITNSTLRKFSAFVYLPNTSP